MGLGLLMARHADARGYFFRPSPSCWLTTLQRAQPLPLTLACACSGGTAIVWSHRAGRTTARWRRRSGSSGRGDPSSRLAASGCWMRSDSTGVCRRDRYGVFACQGQGEGLDSALVEQCLWMADDRRKGHDDHRH